MGNAAGTNKMAISAMANVVNFDTKELLDMQKEFRRLAEQSEPKHTINKEEFHDALRVVGINEDDREILSRLFVLFDHSGDGALNYKEFVCGISTILRGDLVDRLNFSFALYDVDGSNKVSKDEMLTILKWMNNTVSFFGDEALDEEQCEKLVDDVFEECDTNKDGALDYSEYMDAIAKHPNLVAFITKGDHSLAK